MRKKKKNQQCQIKDTVKCISIFEFLKKNFYIYTMYLGKFRNFQTNSKINENKETEKNYTN